MSKVAKEIAIDFESALVDGTPSVEYFRDDFRIISMAIAWESGKRTRYVTGEGAIRRQLQALCDAGHRVIVHNLQFEYGCTLYRFSELADRIDWYCDTQRLIQLADNGINGTKLTTGARNWLPTEYHDHKAPFHALIEERGGEGGKDLHLLTPKELEAYNVRDAEVTLALYESITKRFKEIGYDWTLDYQLYTYETKLYAQSRGMGIAVDREFLLQARGQVDREIAQARGDFYSRNRDGIAAVEARLREIALSKYKTEAGRAKAKLDGCVFNLDSPVHLAMLFVDHYKIQPKFFTETGKPSMSAKFFSQWGEYAAPLKKWGNLEITKNQQDALGALSERDGRIHPSIRVNGTVTGRGAAGEER